MQHSHDNPFQLGVSFRFIVPDERIENLELISKSSVKALELYEPVFNANNSVSDDLSHLFSEAGIEARTIHAKFGHAPDISSVDSANRIAGIADARRAFDLAERVGAKIIIIHASGEPIVDEKRAERIQHAKNCLETIVQYAQERKLLIAIELLPRTCLGRTVDELFNLLDGLDSSSIGVCLDTNHLMGDFRALPDVVRTLGPRLIALHCSDYDGVDEKHWPPLQGVIDWPAFFAALRDINFKGPINYEARIECDIPENKLKYIDANYAKLIDMCHKKNHKKDKTL